jgi:hypothetical protein
VTIKSVSQRRKHDRERALQAREPFWTALFEGSPVRAVVLGPGRIARDALSPEILNWSVKFVVDFGQQLKLPDGRRPLCYDADCGHEFSSLPDVIIAIRTADNVAQLMGTGVCPTCAQKTNSEILEVVRKEMATKGLAPAAGSPSTAEIEVTTYGAYVIPDLPNGMSLHIMCEDDSDVDDDAPHTFAALIKAGKLPRFTLMWQGSHNCHSIANDLRQDLTALNMEADVKMGFSNVTKSDGEPMGLHAWVEIEGWAIDASQGGMGKPVYMRRIAPYREMIKATDIKTRAGESNPQYLTRAGQIPNSRQSCGHPSQSPSSPAPHRTPV